MALEKIVSANLRRIRLSKGISQRQLSTASGVDPRQISKYENDPDSFSLRTIERLAEGLGVQAYVLLKPPTKEKAREHELPKELESGLKEAIRVLRTHLRRVR